MEDALCVHGYTCLCIEITCRAYEDWHQLDAIFFSNMNIVTDKSLSSSAQHTSSTTGLYRRLGVCYKVFLGLYQSTIWNDRQSEGWGYDTKCAFGLWYVEKGNVCKRDSVSTTEYLMASMS